MSEGEAKCQECGDDAKVFPEKRRGLIQKKRWKGRYFCWQCWYYQVANLYLYKVEGSDERDKLIADQIKFLNARAKKRLRDEGQWTELSPDDLMGIIMGSQGVCAVTGNKGHLVFDHKIPLSDGGDHSLENLRPVLSWVNLKAEHGYFNPQEYL